MNYDFQKNPASFMTVWNSMLSHIFYILTVSSMNYGNLSSNNIALAFDGGWFKMQIFSVFQS